jgi:LmbE family N-acetylglucosaminyl deacetylase
MKNSIALIATYGYEIVECGGTLAKHAMAGWEAHAIVCLSRTTFRGDVERGAHKLGVRTRYLEFTLGGMGVDREHKLQLVKALRETKPEIVIAMDPEHAMGDLDPDRRIASLLFLEALSLCGRDWETEAAGRPHSVQSIYYMSPDRPNCLVDISPSYSAKMAALGEMRYQLQFSAQSLRDRMNIDELAAAFPELKMAKDDLEMGGILLRGMETSHSLHYGLAGHSRFGLVEAFRHEGPLDLDLLR